MSLFWKTYFLQGWDIEEMMERGEMDSGNFTDRLELLSIDQEEELLPLIQPDFVVQSEPLSQFP